MPPTDAKKAAAATLQPAKPTAVLEPDVQLNQVRFSPDGELLLATGQDGRLHRWKLAEGKAPTAAEPLGGHNGWATVVAFAATAESPRLLISADSWGRLICRDLGEDWTGSASTARTVWSAEHAHDGWLRAMSLSPGGETLATVGRDGRLRLWATADGKRLVDWAMPPLSADEAPPDLFAVSFTPDGRAVIVADQFGRVRGLSVAGGAGTPGADGKELFALDAGVLAKPDRLQNVGGVRALAFDRAGSRLAVAGTTPKNGGNVQGVPTVLFWDWPVKPAAGDAAVVAKPSDVAAVKPTRTLSVGEVGDVYVTDLAWHPSNGQLLAVISGNPGTGKLFIAAADRDSPLLVDTRMANCQSLALHPLGRRLAVVATNKGSNGNGRQLKNGVYAGNRCPIYLWDLPELA